MFSSRDDLQESIEGYQEQTKDLLSINKVDKNTQMVLTSDIRLCYNIGVE